MPQGAREQQGSREKRDKGDKRSNPFEDESFEQRIAALEAPLPETFTASQPPSGGAIDGSGGRSRNAALVPGSLAQTLFWIVIPFAAALGFAAGYWWRGRP